MKKTQDKIIFQEENKINKPNILINISNENKLTINAKKIYNILLRELLNQDVESFTEATVMTTIRELYRESGIKDRSEVRKTLKELREHTIVFDHTREDGVKTVYTGLITEFEIDKKNQNSLVISFSKTLIKQILSNNDKYTKLDILELSRLKFTHSITIYELFKSSISGHKTQPKNYTETALREKLGLISAYKNNREFNYKVINKAINEVNKNTSLKIELLKIEKPTKSNDLTERVYKFRISQNIEKSASREDFSDFLKSSMKDPKYQYRSHTYTLEEQSVFEAIEGKNTKLWTTKNGNTVSKDTSINIWDSIWKEFSKDQLGTLEKLGYDVEDFIDFLMNKRRKK